MLLVGGGELGHGNQDGTGTVGTGQALQSGLHHGDGTTGVEVGHVHVQAGEDGHGLLDGVGNIVKLQVEEDLVATGLDLTDDGGTLGVVQLHADLHEGLSVQTLEEIEECEYLFCAVKITGYNDVFSHFSISPLL